MSKAKPPRSIVRLFPSVNKMQEARKPVAIEVTAKDVSRGKLKKHRECAMANAVCREWGADHAVIGMTYSYVIKGNTAIKFKTPATVVREIVSFDRNKIFAPGSYHLGPVPPQLTQGAQAESYQQKRSGGGQGSPPLATSPSVACFTARRSACGAGRLNNNGERT